MSYVLLANCFILVHELVLVLGLIERELKVPAVLYFRYELATVRHNSLFLRMTIV
jgi:hypothetical protein